MRAVRPGLRHAAASAALALLAGCTSAAAGTDNPSATAGGATSSGGAASPSVSTPAPAATPPVLSVAGGAKVSYDKPVKVKIANGTLVSAQVETKAGGTLEGEVEPGLLAWVSEEPPAPGTEYLVTADVKDANGVEATITKKFTVATVPQDQRLAFTVTPDAGATVGIAQPVVVRFLTAVTDKAAVEKRLTVTAKAPNGQEVNGAWHWLNDRQVDWRPKQFWPAGTKVHLDMRIAGVKAAPNRYGRKNYSQDFRIGDARVLKVDLVTLKARLYRNGVLKATWPTGGGRPGLETYSGTYVVLDKSPVVQMDSCSAGITCDKKDPDYYDDPEYWATRLTRSGTFVHAADWDGLLGRANVSHGCIHLSGRDAKAFYDQAHPGDPVIVSRSGRGPQQRIGTQDPGLYDWNIPWSKWVAGSALK